ncbi:hypothetical protein [Conexibacter woesei]|uniref:Asl1-like glycosyl hydrolase catalytic domain-containing protein n=1 Tax=Conexibacter woesei (strain DSM 14684 / CCUG 47730 / CIP 108061 / JCM 11494 / NBRC 100937 / ID131577) TaxID=469383 RepID=D3EZE8_CONWI|nr:hypothetical protein [Conexibacter woesei]ADB51913.1 hypothetical protein Cwoe_3495 [Conexibacter woesei DSM 14684]
MKPRRTLPAALAGVLLAVALLAPASSSAFVVGVGDQNPALFENEHLQALGSKRTRLITPYDSVLHRDQRADVDAWMRAARRAGQEIVVAFNPPSGMACPNLNGKRGCRPVSSARYGKAFKAFRKRYPYVRIIQPWNEVNSLTQPTVYRPDAVVTYYDVVRKNCRGCTVLGADIQDLPNMVPYTRSLLAEFRRRRVPTPRLWGMHNYTDTNRFVKDANSSVRKLARLVPGKIWLTETGGLFRFQPQNARQTFRPDLARQARAIDAVFKQAGRYRAKIDRVYLYHWFAASTTNRWDSGVLDAAGAPRPAYRALQKYKRYFR